MEEISINKCNNNEHSEQTATNYCFRCKKFLCETCSTSHYSAKPKHNLFSVEKDLNLNFSGFCKLENHPNKLDYYCSTHNHLCCAACLCKIKDKGDGQHTECKACYIGEIKDEKKKLLKENLKLLKKFSLNMKKMLRDIMNIYERVNPIKEDIIENIKNIFNELRELLVIREQELINDVDNLYSENFFNENYIRECYKYPTIIQYNIEKGKNVIDNWEEGEKNGKLNLIINDSINIENNIQELQNMKNKIDSLNSKSLLQLCINKDDIEIISDKIKNLGNILFYNYKYIFNQCPNDIDDKRKFIISGEKSNIITKKGPNFIWTGTTCLYEFKDNIEYKWKIRILNSEAKQIMIGVVPIDFDLKKMDNTDFAKNICGWYFYCSDMRLYSGPPHNYKNKSTKISNIANEIIVVMNMNRRSLKFIVDNNDSEEQYKDIPIDKPLFPAVCLFNNDIVEIIGL